MKKVKSCKYLIIVLISLTCSSKSENNFKVKAFDKNGLWIEEYKSKNRIYYSICFDTVGSLNSIRTFINESEIEELNFESNGRLFSKLKYNENMQLNGNGYFFYPSGCLKSMRIYKNDMLDGAGVDYYDLSGIVHRNIFYDNTGTYYYRIEYSDTSTYYESFFNDKNPFSYQLVKANAPEPIKSKLLNLMDSLGLNKLNQQQ